MKVAVSIKVDLVNTILELPDHLLKYKNEDGFEKTLEEYIKRNKMSSIYSAIQNEANPAFNGISAQYVDNE